MRFTQRASVATLALALCGLPMALGGTAQAAAPAGTALGATASASMVPCIEPTTDRTDIPAWRQHADTTPITKADLAALAPEVAEPAVTKDAKRAPEASMAPRADATFAPKALDTPAERTRATARQYPETALPATVTIPVYVHVIKGSHRGERSPAGPVRVRNLVRVLNDGFAGKQSSVGSPTRYRFVLKKIRYVKRDGWYHAYLNGPRDKRMKRKLHRGGPRTLNLYINGGGPKGMPVLGWSRLPWQYNSAPKLDGVTVNHQSMPGGKARGYNTGDTVIHETGHWMGLFHTFQGGCSASNDQVVDTPAEAEPSYYCEEGRDTCDSPGVDPVHNFMDYSLDSCMNHFTEGQVARMDSAFEKWRA